MREDRVPDRAGNLLRGPQLLEGVGAVGVHAREELAHRERRRVQRSELADQVRELHAPEVHSLSILCRRNAFSRPATSGGIDFTSAFRHSPEVAR